MDSIKSINSKPCSESSITDDVKNLFKESINKLDKLKDKIVADISFRDSDKIINSEFIEPEPIISDVFINGDDILINNKSTSLDTSSYGEYTVYDMTDIQADITIVSKRDLDNILQDVNDIKYMSDKMGDMLNIQTESINKIEQNVEDTSDNLIKSEKELDKAKRYKINGIVNVAGVMTGSITGSVFGPIGSVIGAGIGLGSAIVINLIRKEVGKN